MMARRRLAAKDGGKFKFCFNSSKLVSDKAEAASHMGKVEAIVRAAAKKSGGRMTFTFSRIGAQPKVL
jgi:hypothetical protein